MLHELRGFAVGERRLRRLMREEQLARRRRRKGPLYRYLKEYEDKEYEDLADARRNVGHFLEAIYNHKRRHSTLGYLSPAEFERRLLKQEAAGDPI